MSGKPTKLYRMTGQQIELTYPVRRFARLAGLLAESLQGQGRDGVKTALPSKGSRRSPR
jgi:hypothetical protein